DSGSLRKMRSSKHTDEAKKERQGTALASAELRCRLPRGFSDVVHQHFRWLAAALEAQGRFLQDHHRVRGDRLGQPDVRPDYRAGPDRRRPAQDGRVRVDDDVIFQGRVPLGSANELTVRVLLEGEGPEGHALVQLDVVADLARLPDHYAGPVVDEEP